MIDGLQALIDLAGDDIDVSDIAHTAIISFADDAKLEMPLTSMSTSDFAVPRTLKKGVFTNYAKVFTKLAETIETDVARLNAAGMALRPPTVFFITDGYPQTDSSGKQPDAEWLPPLNRMHQVVAKGRSKGSTELDSDEPIAVVAVGFAGAQESSLLRIARAPGIACIANPGQAEIDELMRRLLTAIIKSISKSASRGQFSFDPPKGMTILK